VLDAIECENSLWPAYPEEHAVSPYPVLAEAGKVTGEVFHWSRDCLWMLGQPFDLRRDSASGLGIEPSEVSFELRCLLEPIAHDGFRAVKGLVR
jgi:hypothetical protein